MSQSDDFANQTAGLFNRPKIIVTGTFLTNATIGIPDNTWDSSDTAGIGTEFFIGCFVQNTDTGILYRCSDPTPNIAIWNIIDQEVI